MPPTHPTHVQFSPEELTQMAEFICERYDSLLGIVSDPRVTNKRTKDDCQKAADQISDLNIKLRPFYK